ncbi:cyanophycin synthetase [Leptolyngbya sp. O-77]|uniref:ATP-binding protein n=1 Tax=Leptolyngbya sp. O-77 TaxID=1080068 RepID=UPI00074D3B25|nr:cyanophycin synthetase [Leptolyngbya sp. O-77]BAU42698.1 Cyanophycin synthetase [Leptolyngbya sp. O-77]
MVIEESSGQSSPVNARKTDIFDVFGFKHYIGPNPYLGRGALVFRLALTGYRDPLPLDDYVEAIAQRYPKMALTEYKSYADLFVQTVVEVGKLDMDLHCELWSLQPTEPTTIAVESIHESTSYGTVYAVWDWFEAISNGQPFQLEDQIALLQTRFRRSVYGGPTIYALLRAAHNQGIPAFYLPDEGLMQYGYGKKLVRGVATTFDCDSHVDSDFTTRKDDCKAFLSTLGFPVPQGAIVSTLKEALKAVQSIGYPVAVKPVVGHKGIGVTADVQDDSELEFAFDRAVEAHEDGQSIAVIVEQSISGLDHRLLCVDGKFVAATQRRPASVTGDGRSTIAELIALENRKPERLDTPTSPLGKIIVDESLERYLLEQRLDLDSILDPDEVIYLRKVANLSSGGVSIDATEQVHPDNIVLAQDIAQHFRLVCLGIDVLTSDISRSWKEGNFGIIEINAAPGVYMHLRPAVGNSIDVASRILETFFESGQAARIPIFTFNYLPLKELQELVDQILVNYPNWTIGAICRDAAFVNRSQKALTGSYNTKVQSLLRNPKLDLLIAEYDEATLEQEGCFYDGSNIVILDAPTETEKMLSRNIADGATVVIKEGNAVSRRREGLVETYELAEEEPFQRVYWKEISAILSEK